MKRAASTPTFIATLSVLSLVFATQTWPAYEVYRQSEIAVEACGDGYVRLVQAKGFECKPQDGAE